MFKGSIVALVTPMGAGGELDIPALRSLVEWHIESGTSAIVIGGTTGESANLSEQELETLIRESVQVAAGRVDIIAGNGATSTEKAIKLTELARNAGANACLCVTPYYLKTTQHGLVHHFTEVAKSSPLPQILYNVPGRTGCDMLNETVVKLAEVENIVGLKDATADLSRVDALRDILGNEFALLSGDDASALEFVQQGGHGVVSVTANVAPLQMARVFENAATGNWAEAEAINASLTALHQQLFCEPNPIPVKWALQRLNKIDKGIRSPLLPLSEVAQPLVSQALQSAKLIAESRDQD